jgi:hypothetical protein
MRDSIVTRRRIQALTIKDRAGTSQGAILNLMAQDCMQLQWFFNGLADLMKAPVLLAVGIWLLYLQVRAPCAPVRGCARLCVFESVCLYPMRGCV